MTTPSRPVRIAFLLMRPQVWGAFETIVEAAVAHPDVHVELVLAEDPGSGYRPHAADELRELLAPTGLELRDNAWLVDHLDDFDVAFFHDAYVEEWGKVAGLGAHVLLDHGVRIAVSPYALALHGHEDITRFLFNMPLHHSAWRIYAPSEGQVANYHRFSATGAEQVRFRGYVKQERLVTSAQVAREAARLREHLGTRTVTLWNPHFQGRDDVLTFPIVAPVMVGWAAAHPDQGFIFRPHPRLFTDLQKIGGDDAEAVRQFRAACGRLPNVILDESPDGAPALRASDAMVSDLSSMIAEYRVLDRPVGLLVPAEGLEINDLEGILDGLPQLRDAADIERFLSGVAPAPPVAADGQPALGSGARIVADVVETFRAEQEAEALEAARPPATGTAVSVIVPTYDGADRVLGCLDSLAAQSLPWHDFEVVMVENGPATDTAARVDAWLAAHPGFQLRLARSEPAGVSRARNLGLELAQAPYVTFVDDDDRVGPRYLETLLADAAPRRVTAVLTAALHDGDFAHPDVDGYFANRELAPFWGTTARNADLAVLVLYNHGKLVAADIARSVRFREDLRLGEDTIFWLEVGNVPGVRLRLTDPALESAYLYNHRADSAMAFDKDPTWEDDVEERLKVVAVVEATPVIALDYVALRTRVLRGQFRAYIRRYGQFAPHDVPRVIERIRELGVRWTPWSTPATAVPVDPVPLARPLDGRPLVSIVVPSHAEGSTLRRCLDSLALQTVAPEDFEILVVHNGSGVDGKRAQVDQWQQANPRHRLRFLVCGTESASAARNTGLDVAEGEYVTFVDDDDEVRPRFLEGLLDRAAPDRITMVPAYTVFDLEDAERPSEYQWGNGVVPLLYQGCTDEVPIWQGLAISWGRLVSTALARDIRWDERAGHYGEDKVFWFALWERHRPTIVGSALGAEAAYLYHTRSGSLMLWDSATSWETHVERVLAMLACMEEVPSGAYAVAAIRFQLQNGPYRRLRMYLAEHPEEAGRVNAAIAAAGLKYIQWDRLHNGLATCLTIAEADDPETGHALAAHGTLTDVATYTAQAGSDTVWAGEALPILDRWIPVAGPELVTWELSAGVFEYLNTALAERREELGSYRTLRSRSRGPLEHLVAALFKIQQPDLHWTAELVPGGHPADDAAVVEGPLLDVFAAAFLRAMPDLEFVPETLGAFAAFAARLLADEVVSPVPALA